MQLTQRTRFRMLFSLPIPTCTSSEGRHRSLLGLPPSCLTALDYNYVGGQNTSKCLSTNPPGDLNQLHALVFGDQEMIEQTQMQAPQKEANVYASREDFHTIFNEDLRQLYHLSFLLTRDPAKAERCLVVGLEDCVRKTAYFVNGHVLGR